MIHAGLLMAAATAAAPTLPPRPPDATYTYTLMLAGSTIGTSVVAIDGSTPGTIVVKESASFSVPRFTATTSVHYDAATLAETTYSGDFNLPNGPQHTDVTVKSGVVSVSVGGSAGRTGLDIPADASAPLELIGDNLAGTGMLVPALLHATGAKAFTLAVLSGGKAIVAKVGPDASERPAAVPAADASLSIDFAGLHEIFWYDPATYVVHDVLVPEQQGEFRLTSTTVAGVAVAVAAVVATAVVFATPVMRSPHRAIRPSHPASLIAGMPRHPHRWHRTGMPRAARR